MILTTEHQELVDALQEVLLAGHWARPGGPQRLSRAFDNLLTAVEQLDPEDQRELVPLLGKMTAWDKAIGRVRRKPSRKNIRAVQETQKAFADETSKLFEQSLAALPDN